MVAGDVIGVKKETKVAGDYNVTNVSNVDDTKKVHHCAISGEHLTFADIRTCPLCHQEVSSRCFEETNRRCFNCRDVAEAELKAEIESRYGDDFRIDAEEARNLVSLQSRLKIPRERYQQLEREVRDKILAERRYDYGEGKSAIPGIKKKIETAAKAIAQSKPQVALKLLQSTWEECRDNKEYETVYLSCLLLCQPESFEAELKRYTYDDLSIHVFKARGLAVKGTPEAAQKYIASNRGLGFAYRNEPEWRLLPVEFSIDQALLDDEELLRRGYLDAARDEFASVESMLPDGPLVVFIRDYLNCVETAGPNRQQVVKWLTAQMRSLQAVEHLAPNEVAKLASLIMGKLEILERAGISALAEDSPIQEAPQSSPSVESASQIFKCRHCGFALPSDAQFCGSCGRAASPVRIFLDTLGLGQYSELFDNNRIDETVITEISEQDLKNIGITSLGHRKRIAAAIADFDWPD